MASEAETPAEPRPPRRRRRRWVGAILLILAIALAWFFIPRRADLRRFDPKQVAALEAGMWRDYYLHERLPLASKLYQLWRGQYGFSPFDSIRVAARAASAAITFKDSTSDAEADKALPALHAHFELIAARANQNFDVDQAAEKELYWWKIRRHKVGPVEYGHAVARATAELYHVDPDLLEPYAHQLRAAAMDYRDQRRLSMSDADWEKVRLMLVDSLTKLKQVVGDPAR